MLKSLVLCICLWELVSPTENPSTYSVLNDFTDDAQKVKRAVPTTPAYDEQLSTQSSTNTMEAIYATSLETNRVLTELYKAFTGHVSKHSAAIKESGRQVTRHLLQETEILRQKLLQQEADALQMREIQLRIERENEFLKREIHLAEGEKRMLEEANRRLRGEQQDATEENAASRKGEGCPITHGSSLQQLTQYSQNVTDPNTQLLYNTIINLQEHLFKQLQVESQPKERDNDGIKEQLEDCQQSMKEMAKKLPVDCEELHNLGVKESKVLQIFPSSSPAGVHVYCEVEDGQVWTVILARRSQPPHENFTRTWHDYKNGFGDPEGEYWLGNDNLHSLTGGAHSYSLKLKAQTAEQGQKSSQWRYFSVGDEASQYRLELRGYDNSSTFGDGFTDSILDRNGLPFSTIDRDNVISSEGRSTDSSTEDGLISSPRKGRTPAPQGLERPPRVLRST
ncbi:uncharacterized protein [Panulirus ornatus]|uniref:uncharacterized protein isoform X2 n=1 Tax=Panulirus ornatus TaxID=150431 RepID=UPI003A8ACD11